MGRKIPLLYRRPGVIIMIGVVDIREHVVFWSCGLTLISFVISLFGLLAINGHIKLRLPLLLQAWSVR
jgi:hypothetical protein